MSMRKDRSQSRVPVMSLLMVLTLLVSFGSSPSATAQVAANNTSRMLSNAENLGAEDLSKQVTVTVWLKHHNQTGFDELVRQMYDRNSPSYHHFLTLEQYKANFAPNCPGSRDGPGLPYQPQSEDFVGGKE
jgi:subtilase family serine protease